MDFEVLRQHILSSDKIVVPDNAAFTGGSRENFVDVGCAVLGDIIARGLKPDSRVLEIGSGLGRIAYPMTFFLDRGEYVGLEIVKDSVDFCRQHVVPLSSPLAHFEFLHIDCYNEFYNPHASTRLADLAFPELGEFDFVFMSSVCTHLSDSEMRLYLELAAHWTRIGGIFWSTFFLIDSDAEDRLLNARSSVSLPFDLSYAGPDYYLDGRRSTVAVAYRREYIESLYPLHGLRINTVDLGVWSGAKRDYGGYQDVIVATKT